VEGFGLPEFAAVMEKQLCTLLMPQLIRHIQIFYESMRRVKTTLYFKVGTSGTGGMGLNIPYTHSEEKPSRVLLSKSAIAGAHTMLLFLMARTPDAPITKEIKPTAAIAWKKIAYGPIIRQGKPVVLYDCPPGEAVILEEKLQLKAERSWTRLQQPDGQEAVLHSVFIDTGENGLFSRGEFEALTTPGQMEFVTPEEIAHNLIYEIKGGNTGHDIINALDNATLAPTYRAGAMRQSALDRLAELERIHQVDSVAFEMLGPPRVTKLLYEAYLLKLTCRTLKGVLEKEPRELACQLEDLLRSHQQLRSTIISIGIPILLADGRSLLRGPEIKTPPFNGSNELPATAENIEHWSGEGWIDLRPKSLALWQRRIRQIFQEIAGLPAEDSSSRFCRDRRYWLQEEEINIGKVVSWILAREEHGERIKD
ncbi:MAG: short-chain dehydrogenase, partial [Candidatus Tectomicrobia bacterium]|nr:short-chain dehydrogenase [Candidatus Tectomicrobia bacterium]